MPKLKAKKRRLALEAHGCQPLRSHRLSTVVKHYLILDTSVEVTLTNDNLQIEEWISAHMAESFGLDIEWKPTFKKGARENPVALLQLSTLQHCLLIQMQRLNTMPEGLTRLLAAPEVSLTGVGIRDDLRKLTRDFGFVCCGGVELAALAGEVLKRPELRKAGVKTLAMEVLQKELIKTKKVSMSNWELDLKEKQIAYAAADAWVSHAVHHQLRQGHAKEVNQVAAIPAARQQPNGAHVKQGKESASVTLGGQQTEKGHFEGPSVEGQNSTAERVKGDGVGSALAAAFAEEMERRQADPHKALLEDRRRSLGRQGGVSKVPKAAEKMAQENLEHSRDSWEESDVRDDMEHGIGEAEKLQAGPRDQGDAAAMTTPNIEGKVTVLSGGQLTKSEIRRRRKKKERQMRYGGKKTALKNS